MTDFVINEKDGMEAVRLISCNSPQTAQAFESVFRSRPLSEEIKKEGEKYKTALILTTIQECRKIIGDKVIFGRCPFKGDCGQCFLCDNSGGCIVESSGRGDTTEKQYSCKVRGDCNQYKNQGNRVTSQCMGCGSLHRRGVKK